MKTLKSARGRELLIDRALSGLTPGEREELASLLAQEGLEGDDSFDLAAAALDLATAAPPDEPLPAALAAQVEREGRRLVADPTRPSAAPPRSSRANGSTTAAGAQVVVMPMRDATGPARDWTRWAGWIAAAAALALVVGKSLATPAPQPSAEAARAGASSAPSSVLTPPLRTVAGVAAADPRAAGASAELSWSDSDRRGELRVRGLSPGDYELWLEDAARGDRYRLAAGSFTARGGAESVLPVAPAIKPVRPARLLVTTPTEDHEPQPLVIVTLGTSP
jgi:hypothetical protein